MLENGVWRTVAGRRIFIKEGQSLTDAMKESGKFNKMPEKMNNRKNLVATVKNQIDVDLDKAATERQFAPRRGLNIDSRKLNQNEFNSVKSFLNKNNIRFESNGVFEWFITYEK